MFSQFIIAPLTARHSPQQHCSVLLLPQGTHQGTCNRTRPVARVSSEPSSTLDQHLSIVDNANRPDLQSRKLYSFVMVPYPWRCQHATSSSRVAQALIHRTGQCDGTLYVHYFYRGPHPYRGLPANVERHPSALNAHGFAECIRKYPKKHYRRHSSLHKR